MNFSTVTNQFNRFKQWLKVDLKLSRKGLILVFVPLSFVLILMFYLATLLSEAEVDLWREADSKMLIARANDLSRDFVSARQAESPAELNLLCQDIITQIDTLKKLTLDNPSQAKNIGELERSVNIGLSLLQKNTSTSDKTAQLNKWLNDLNMQVVSIDGEEQEELNRNILKSSNARSMVVEGLYLGVILNIVLAIMMAMYFSKGITERLALVFENSKRMARGQALLPEQTGRDEIARLDRVFHQMAEVVAAMAHKQQAVMDNTADVIFTINSRGQFSMVNNACLKSWGYSPEELIGQRITTVLYKADRALTMVLINKLIKGAFSRTFETRLVKKDGTVIDLLLSATWSKLEDALFCVAHDITQRKEVERLKRDFYAMMSHDLRTPLTSILFSINIALKRLEALSAQLRKKENIAEVTEELQAAERNSAQLLKLIDNLLAVEKIEAGQVTLIPRHVKLVSLVNKAEESVAAYAKQQEVKLSCQAQEAVITVDEDRLFQVLMNLLGNAIKFSPAGSQVNLSANIEDDHLICKISDQGPGIPEQFLKDIFERYRQIKMPSSQGKTGIGLGLTISQAIVKAHGGEIGVESILGKGSTFWFKIPVISSK